MLKWFQMGMTHAAETLTAEAIAHPLSREDVEVAIQESFELDLERITSNAMARRCLNLAVDGYIEEFVRRGGTIDPPEEESL